MADVGLETIPGTFMIRKGEAVLSSEMPTVAVAGGVAIVRLTGRESFFSAAFAYEHIRSQGLIVEA